LLPKYFYDDAGARLFEQICTIEEYYPTRTELGILQRNIGEIVGSIGPHCRLVEFGSGSGIKTRILLRSLDRPAAYLPVDISRAQLVHFALSVADGFPELEVLPICADYTADYQLPEPARADSPTVAFFPGSTIGNFETAEAEAFLRRVREVCGGNGGLLIGVDLKKDPAVIERAYNDRGGVTAAFNLNLLARINRECDADFDLRAFEHHAPYDEANGRIEMRLVSRHAQSVRIAAGGDDPRARVDFEAGEHIITEYSHKYSLEEFEALSGRAGWRIERIWTDPNSWFGIVLLR
jgi:dimethylhistidine N-methyltransferase